MSNASGWGLTARLVSKHFGALGDRISEAIANFDPETATEADRDRLAETLRESAQLLASARSSYEKEAKDVVSLQNLIANDERATDKLAELLAAGKMSEAAITLFCDELEANKNRLPQEIQEEADAQAYMNELQSLVDALTQQLTEFDANAKKAMQAVAKAEAERKLQELRLERQRQLEGLANMKGASTALSALSRRAEAVSNEAAGLRIVADINQKPLDQKAELDAIRKSVSQPDTAGETALQRLQRLSNKAAA